MKQLSAVIKSHSDTRIYKAFELNNKIQCLIINDANA